MGDCVADATRGGHRHRVDDALALILLASLEFVSLEHVTTTHGNCSTEASTANARLVLDTCALAHVPVTGGLSFAAQLR